MSVEPTQLVDDVMRQWPASIRLFLDRRMHCVGCPIACFHTVDDACREHGVDCEKFLEELKAIVVQQQPRPSETEGGPIVARWPARS